MVVVVVDPVLAARMTIVVVVVIHRAIVRTAIFRNAWTDEAKNVNATDVLQCP